MSDIEQISREQWRNWRLLIIGLVAVLIVIALVFIVATIGRSSAHAGEEERVNALADSDDECVE